MAQIEKGGGGELGILPHAEAPQLATPSGWPRPGQTGHFFGQMPLNDLEPSPRLGI